MRENFLGFSFFGNVYFFVYFYYSLYTYIVYIYIHLFLFAMLLFYFSCTESARRKEALKKDLKKIKNKLKIACLIKLKICHVCFSVLLSFLYFISFLTNWFFLLLFFLFWTITNKRTIWHLTYDVWPYTCEIEKQYRLLHLLFEFDNLR